MEDDELEVESNLEDINDESNEDELDISFESEEEGEDEKSEPEESSTIQTLRKELRAKERRLAELEKNKPAQEEELILGAEPNLDDPDIDFDTDKFKAAYRKYVETAAEIERRKNAPAPVDPNAAKQLEIYQSQVKALGVANHKKYEDQFIADTKGFEKTASVILRAAKDKALIVYALGKHPAKLDALLDINDEIELAAEVARIERSVKVNKAPSKFKPEQTVRGNVSPTPAGKVDKHLERLEKEAAQTGNRTKVIEYKRSLNK